MVSALARSRKRPASWAAAHAFVCWSARRDEEVVALNVSEQVRALVEPLLATQGVEVVDVERLGATLRVTIDRPGGIDLDAVSDATQVVSAALDRHDAEANIAQEIRPHHDRTGR